jgi:hypothetical protein
VIGRGGSFLVTLRSGVPGQRKLGTHSHLDHLASDIWIAGGARVADPGSWCYGASPTLRNRYRSNRAHFTPLWQVDWSESLRHPFFIDRPPPAATLAKNADSFWGLLQHGSGWVSRIVTLRGGELIVLDLSSRPDLTPWPWQAALPLADGYFGRLWHDPCCDPHH